MAVQATTILPCPEFFFKIVDFVGFDLVLYCQLSDRAIQEAAYPFIRLDLTISSPGRCDFCSRRKNEHGCFDEEVLCHPPLAEHSYLDIDEGLT